VGWLCLALPYAAHATSVPNIEVYHKKDYRGGQANRGFAQDRRGNIYIANSEGLLTFNGQRFEIFPISNKTQVLALGIDDQDLIYVGGQGDFGYFSGDAQGRLSYTSLKEYIPQEHQDFSDVRNICIAEEGVYFKSILKIFYWDKSAQTISVYKTGDIVEYINYLDGQLFIDDPVRGISTLENGRFSEVNGGDIFSNYEVSSILKWENDLLISTWDNGLFIKNEEGFIPFESLANNIFKKEQIKHCAIDPHGQLVVGTVAGGIYFLDKEGQIRQHINKEKGLKSNSIQHLYYDQFNNLWVGLENGINYLKMGEPFRRIFPNPEQELIGYASKVFNDKLYLATSLGLYVSELSAGGSPLYDQFSLVSGSGGLCWNLSEVRGELYLHKHNGFYKVKEGSLEALHKNTGSWIAQALHGDPRKFLEGTYFGINIFEGNKKVKSLNFKESSRIIEQSNRIIWVSHDYKGAYKIQYDDGLMEKSDVTYYNTKDGFPSNIDVNVFSINDEIVFTTEEGIFQYDDTSDSIVPHPVLNNIFGTDSNLKRLIQDDYGRLWFVDRKKVGFINLNDYLSTGQLQKKYLPELEGLLVEHFQHIYPYSKNEIFFGTENGFIVYHLDFMDDGGRQFQTQIDKISISPALDSIIHHGFALSEGKTGTLSPPSIHFRNNSIQFEFSSNYFSDLNSLLFSTQLAGYDQDWSEWNHHLSRTFTNLRPGDYTFLIKSKNSKDIQSKITSYSFTILPPWYSTTLAKILYFLLATSGLYLLWMIPRKRHQRETQVLKKEQKQELAIKEKIFTEKVRQSEQELMQLKNEKLEDEVNFKNQELASSTMHLVQKGEMLQNIKEELLKIQKIKEPDEVRGQLKKVIRKIDQDLNLDENWEHFERYFDQVHTDFIKNLREKYPQLTPKDYKLCVYLRMNLSSKEIATLMNITTRSVEVSRYRLRKRLDIDTNTNLTEFIMDV
jgi:ligand-binding sensor domain-containing protein/DNA-binding CsgD family transcriptional regulator